MKGHINKYLTIITIFILISSYLVGNSLADSNDEVYGFIINVTSDQDNCCQTNISRLINKLLQDDFQVYWSNSYEEIFVKGLDSDSIRTVKLFSRGSFFIPYTNDIQKNENLTVLIYLAFLSENIDVYNILEPIKLNGYLLQNPKIANIEGFASHTYQKSILNYGGFKDSIILSPEEIINGLSNDDYNLFIWGGYVGSNFKESIEYLKNFTSPDGQRLIRNIRNFVKNGGGFMGFCYGGYMAASGFKRPLSCPFLLYFNRFITFLPVQLNLLDINIYQALPGIGFITIEIVDNNCPISYGLPKIIDNHLYARGPLFIEKLFGKNVKPFAIIKNVDLERFSVDDIARYTWWGNCKLVPDKIKDRLKQNWIKNSIGKPISVTGTYGEGKVIAYGSHPEITSYDPFSTGYCDPPRTFYNSVFYATSKGLFERNFNNSFNFENTLDVDAGGPYVGEENVTLQLSGSVNNGTYPYKWYWKFEPTNYHLKFRLGLDYIAKGQYPIMTFDYWGNNIKAVVVVLDSNGNIGFDQTEINIIYN